MNTQSNMENDLAIVLSQLIVEHDDDTKFRFQAQDEALKELRCVVPRLGEWIDRCDYSFLIDTLKLNEEIFAEEFPEVRLPLDERARFAEILIAHCDGCAHCHLKRSYDAQWESCVDKALTANKEAIGLALGHAAYKK